LSGNGSGRVEVKQACTVLYNDLPPLDSADLQERLASLVGPCQVEWAESSGSNVPLTAGLAQFEHHRIALIALNAPVKQDVLARTVGVSPMPEEVRDALWEHRAAIRLLYVGDDEVPAQQLTALYMVAGVLLEEGGLGILNERAAIAQPTELVKGYLAQLGREPLPLPMWIGVVTYVHEENSAAQRYLMRTYGLEQFALPELAAYFGDQGLADETYHLLLNVALYTIENGGQVQIAPGHTADFHRRTYLFTEPTGEDPQFNSPTGLRVLVEV